MSLAKYRRVVLDNGSAVFASATATEGRYVVSRALAGGTTGGIVERRSPREWSATTFYGMAVWEEATGRNWPTLRAACEALMAAVEE